ncbi:hypothetical protein B0T10DRAFT_417978 [Thelonectria olida]|uniref:2EXR domain-containing protein n=1 Tax=Thelonectria olida TaxID=1576542 RepID=A0A9P9AEL2_9HYPO|nr:hypothetical protein B0T10DRAFT_417978 [Thelonectria olida]
MKISTSLSRPSSFPAFATLPLELRQQIWRLAILMRSSSVVSVKVLNDTVAPRLSFRTTDRTKLISVILACGEASEEWSRMKRYFVWGILPRSHISRATFLLHDPLYSVQLLKSPSTSPDIIYRMKHVSVGIVPDADIVAILSALASFPHLETIIVIAPSCLTHGEVHLKSLESPSLIETLTEIMDDRLPSDDRWTHGNHINLLVQGRSPRQAVERLLFRTQCTASQSACGPMWSGVLPIE